MRKRNVVNEGWETFAKACLPEGAGPVQSRQTKDAFYAGATSVFFGILEQLSPGADPENADLSMMDDIESELRAYVERAKAR